MTPPSAPCEYTLVKKPLIDLLTTEYGLTGGGPGYVFIPKFDHAKYVAPGKTKCSSRPADGTFRYERVDSTFVLRTDAALRGNLKDHALVYYPVR